jgi:hypothetical protein
MVKSKPTRLITKGQKYFKKRESNNIMNIYIYIYIYIYIQRQENNKGKKEMLNRHRG